MIKLNLLFFALALILSRGLPPGNDPNDIIDKAIKKHGGKKYTHVKIDFDFRDRHYVAIHQKNGKFQYERIFLSSGDSIRDVLNNDGFYRLINGQRTDLPPEKSKAYANSVNSVIYFALLPYKLNDPAVKKTYLGEVTIKDAQYHKIRVTFSEENGGRDHDDVFVYWVHKEFSMVTYLAYRFYADGGGMRFRCSYNRRREKGILFQDYLNFKSDIPDIKPEQLDTLFEKDQLECMSMIELKNIQVRPI